MKPVFLELAGRGISGVNTFVAALMDGLRSRGFEVGLIDNSGPIRVDALPTGVTEADIALCTDPDDGRRRQRQRLVEFLSRSPPSVVLPSLGRGADVVPLLPDHVHCVYVVHSDDPRFHRCSLRLGPWFDAIVGVSEFLASYTGLLLPEASARIRHIPYGVPAVEAPPKPRTSETSAPLEIIYCGRLVHEQKRVLDLIALARLLRSEGVDARLAILGDGPDLAPIRQALEDEIAAGTVCLTGRLDGRSTQSRLRRGDIFVLPSLFEGLPLALLEAMSVGCVPIVGDIASGVGQLVREGETGFLVMPGDVASFAARIKTLCGDRELLRRLSRAATSAASQRCYTDAGMTAGYAELFDNMSSEAWPRRTQRRPISAAEAGRLFEPPPPAERVVPIRLLRLVRRLLR